MPYFIRSEGEEYFITDGLKRFYDIFGLLMGTGSVLWKIMSIEIYYNCCRRGGDNTQSRGVVGVYDVGRCRALIVIRRRAAIIIVVRYTYRSLILYTLYSSARWTLGYREVQIYSVKM